MANAFRRTLVHRRSPSATHDGEAGHSRWRNWAGNQEASPSAVVHPTTSAELARTVGTAHRAGQQVKVVGSGHSFTDIACTSGIQIRLDRYRQVLDIDPERQLVRVQAGSSLWKLSEKLAARGLALENLGDIAEQTVAGAIATATHGTGARFGGLATQVEAIELVIADGTIVTCSATSEPEIFAAASVGLGALGVVSVVTLRCVPAFTLRAVEEPARLDDVLANLDAEVASHDHFEFYWVPHTPWVLTKRNDRTDLPPGGRGRVGEFRDRVLVENVAFGAVCRLGRWAPALTPYLARLVAGGAGRTEYVDQSHRVFASPRLVHFVEMEYALPADAAAGAVRAVTEWVASTDLRLSFPVEVRFSAGDDILLSTASGRPSAYIAVHMYRGQPYERYFRGVEAIMDSVGGRPHWGKVHFQTAATLAGRYPGWERWQMVRRQLDEDGTFSNAYLDRVVGPVS